jgi:YD repeat-containing protein
VVAIVPGGTGTVNATYTYDLLGRVIETELPDRR